MKKLLIVLLSLMVVGALAFAQDAAKPTVTVGGRVETGIQISPDAKTAVLHDDDSGTPGRIRLDTTVVLGDFDLFVRVASDTASNASDVTNGKYNMNNITNYYAGYKFLDGKVILRAGNPDAATTGTVNKGWGDGINPCGGVQAIVAPIDGLFIGGAIGNLSNSSQTLGKTLEQPAVGFAYAMPGFGDIRVNWETYNRLFTAGVNYTAMAGLKAQVEGYYITGDKYTTNTTSKSEFELFQDFAYTVSGFTPEVVAYEGKNSDDALAFSVNPQVAYAASSVITLGAGVTYVSDKDNIATKDITFPYGAAGDKSTLSASPYIQFNFNSLASCLKIWYDTGDLSNSSAKNSKFEINFRSFF
jgi:hypothetical protein